jgi:hypothetical protein
MAEFAAKFVLAVVGFGRTAMTPRTGVRATGLSQIWSKEGLVIPELGPIDFNILKTHLSNLAKTRLSQHSRDSYSSPGHCYETTL